MGVWKSIRKGWDTFKQYVRFEVGNGSRVLFGQDVWCGELPLKIVFPALFTIACAKEARVEENMVIVNGAIHWNVLFLRPVHDWELEEVSRFFEVLYSQHIRHGGEDKICWIPSMNSYYKMRIKSHVIIRILSSPLDA